jgi:hypothetical protein
MRCCLTCERSTASAPRPPEEEGRWAGPQDNSKGRSPPAAIAFDLGEDLAARVIATARYGTVIYAAVRAAGSDAVFGLVLLAERHRGALYTKAISEDMGPAEDGCPARILDLLSEPSNDHARDWRRRCRERVAHAARRKP